MSDPWMWRELRRPLRGPDVTGPVMERLGIGASTPRRAARRRAARIAARAIICASVAAGGAMLLRAWAAAGRGGPSPGPTIPAAIRHDLAHHGRTIGEAIRTIQSLGGVQAARGEPDPGPAPPREEIPPEEAPGPPRV
jgi:hypothetical protein